MEQLSAWMGVVVGVLLSVSVSFTPIDINKADAELLADEVGGLDLGQAEAIVRYRERNGAFTSVEQLTNVPGISKLIIENNRGNLTVGTPAGKSA